MSLMESGLRHTEIMPRIVILRPTRQEFYYAECKYKEHPPWTTAWAPGAPN